MPTTLGEKLRQAREERGISISEVAEQTRISPMYLESIENDNYKPLPGGIFNKGFVRSYAKYVGIDEHEALQDYARLIAANDAAVEEQQPRYRPEVLTDDARSASSIVPTVLFAGVILALMTGGILFVVNYIKNQPDFPTVNSNIANTASNSNSNTEVTDTNSAPPSVPDQIRIEFRALSEKVSVTSTVDGNLAYDEITPEAPKSYTAQQALKLRYYRGFADKVQITLNGKQLVSPPPPAKGNVEIEITKDNVAQIMESGQIAPAGPTAPAGAVVQSTPTPGPGTTPPTTTSTPAPVAGRPTATPPRPAFTPIPTPRRTPTPIIVGRPPGTRPSPN
ncbi:MAG TPA: helix-turn-helix domain-containing protein [Pyrinomonadaceae bacterium]|nr:helix-turn-helix domain-containing protein [Pyrinomonadaceae bacterium]